ncbi:cell division protein ZapA [Acidomonas methanolica]|uniref:cell division protein ZapA n=1 Tax=Acidomonas methanolica TaxID=437 RepID=UPI00211A10C6|nr:cell division protein ZapA [Acidomonas methanolica]MCQ9156001.1 cell division protein ZapA [Acidomonas methanolica]
MAQVSIRLNGYSYTVGCQDGEERHLMAMAAQVERRIDRVRALGAPGGEARMLVLAALLMADEIHDLAEARLPSSAMEKIAAAEQIVRERDGERTQLLDLAERAESIAAALEAF